MRKKYGFVEITSEPDVNERDVKYCLRTWFENNSHDSDKMQIHDVVVKTIVSDNKLDETYIEVTFYTGRPGLLIGKAGNTIDDIAKTLTDYIGLPVKCLIVEYDWKYVN